MKKFRLDFTQDNPCLDGCYIGHIGEHNATELVITPPAEVAENEAVTSYIIAFTTGGMIIHSEPFDKAETLSVPIWQQLTLNPILGIQLEAYDDAGKYIGKSEYISGLRLLPSAGGNDTPADTDNPDFVSMYLKTNHSHDNKDILDLFGINPAKTLPTFKGLTLESTAGCAGRYAELYKILYDNFYTIPAADEKISTEINMALESLGGSGSRTVAVKEDNDTNSVFELYAILNANSTGLHIVDYSETIPEGAEISKVELKKTEGDTWIDIRHMYFAEEKPYIIHMGQAQRLSSGELCCASIVFTSGLNSWAELAQSTYIYGIRVTYYTD